MLAVSSLSTPAAVFQLDLKPGSRVEAGRVTLHAAMLNRGDEDMNNVQAAVRFEGQTQMGPVLTVLHPGDPAQVDLDAGPVPAIRGRYTAIVTARYTDRYGHPFMTIEPIPVYTAEPTEAPALKATLSRIILGSGQPLSLRLTSQAVGDLDAHCRLILPDELRCGELERTVSVPGQGGANVTFSVANAWATADSQYRVYVVVDSIRAGLHESLVASGLVTIPVRRALAPATVKRLWIIPGTLLLAFLLAQFLPRRVPRG